MPVQTDHLADEIKDLTASVNDLRADLAGFKGSIEKELQLTRTLGKYVAGFLVAIVASGFGLAWQAGTLSAEVRLNAVHLEKRMDRLEARFDRLDARFDRVEQQVIQLDKRMDKTDAKLDQIIQRLDQVVPKPNLN